MPLADTIYRVLPPSLQNAAITLYGFKWRRERMGGKFGAYVDRFRERDRWTRAEMEHWVEEQLRAYVLLAFDEVPYYKAAWRNAGLSRPDLACLSVADLPRLPITPKQHLRREPDAFVCVRTLPQRNVRRYYSSGSTGTPVTSVCTPDDHRRFIAAREARSFGWANVSLRCSRSMIGGRLVITEPNARPPYYRHNWAERQTYFSAYHISPATAADYVEGFNRYRPEVLTGYAQSYYLLARMMRAQHLSLAYEPKALILSSEKLNGIEKTTVQEAFRARAYEEYGAVENCVLATECEHGSLHAHPDFGILEIVDDFGFPVAPGQEGRLVCTGLLNQTQFLIRYEIGDLGRWSEYSCRCGRDHLPVLDEVVGRIEDIVVGPDGREMVRFHGIFINLPHVVAGQVVQESRDHLRIRVITSPGYGEEDEDLIRSRIFERLGSIRLTIEQAEQLEKTARGKVRAVISRI